MVKALTCIYLLFALNGIEFTEIFKPIQRITIPALNGIFDPLPSVTSEQWTLNDRHDLYFAGATLRKIDIQGNCSLINEHLSDLEGIAAIAFGPNDELIAFNRHERNFFKIDNTGKATPFWEFPQIRDLFSFFYNPVNGLYYGTGEWFQDKEQAFFLLSFDFKQRQWSKLLFSTADTCYNSLLCDRDTQGRIYCLKLTSGELSCFTPEGTLLFQTTLPNDNTRRIGGLHIILNNYLLVPTFSILGGILKYGLDIYNSKGESIIERISYPTTYILLKTDRSQRVYFQNRDRSVAKNAGNKYLEIVDIYEVSPSVINH